MKVDDELAEFGVVTSTTARAHWRGGGGQHPAARVHTTQYPGKNRKCRNLMGKMKKTAEDANKAF